MTVQRGQTLSHYRLAEKIGEGGMGVVWKAEDTTLRRPVAIKLLTERRFDEEVLRTRFLREARLAAALNHPAICSVYEVGEVTEVDSLKLPSGGRLSVGIPYLAMEFIEGQSLDQVNRDSGALPLEDSLRIAIQVAEGLAAAHAKGIVHRDLKPGNVMLTRDERVKILDFGLAKNLWQADPDDAVLTQAETVSEELTKAGMVVGTVAYMSPEQAKGEPLDSRSDIFSFGIMLYEMICGHRPFRGETSETTRLKIIESEPEPFPETGTGAPPELERIIWRCLCKKPAERFNDTRDLVLALRDLGADTSATQPPWAASRTPATAERPTVRSARWLPWTLLALMLSLAVVAGYMLGHLVRRPGLAAGPSLSFEILPEEGIRLPTDEGSCFAVDDSGRRVVYVGAEDENRRLYLRWLDQVEATVLPGTDGAISPFFSPDGEQIAFFAGGRMKRASLRDHSITTICEATGAHGGYWTEDGTIIFAPGQGSGLLTVKATGGIPTPASHVDSDRRGVEHRFPAPLPDPNHVLFTIHSEWEYEDPLVAVLNRKTGEHRVLIENASSPAYVSTGHLAFVRNGSLMAAPFDSDLLEVTGQPLTVVDGGLGSQGRDVITSSDGSLVYLSRRGSHRAAWERQDRLAWVDRDGNLEQFGDPPGAYVLPTLSHDGRSLAFTLFEPNGYDLWVRDLRRGTTSRLTHEGNNHVAVWAADDRGFYFTSDRDGPPNLYFKSLDGSLPVDRLTDGPYHQDPISVSPDNRFLMFWDNPSETGGDLMLLDLEERTAPTPALATKFDETHGVISPDGRFLAYTSDDSGRSEVYVQPFPEPGARTQISINGGREPRWNPAGGELFFWAGDQRSFMTVRVETSKELRVGIPQLLFSRPFRRHDAGIPNYDVAPDGSSFLMIQIGAVGEPVARLTVKRNWNQDLRRRFLSSSP